MDYNNQSYNEIVLSFLVFLVGLYMFVGIDIS